MIDDVLDVVRFAIDPPSTPSSIVCRWRRIHYGIGDARRRTSVREDMVIALNTLGRSMSKSSSSPIRCLRVRGCWTTRRSEV